MDINRSLEEGSISVLICGASYDFLCHVYSVQIGGYYDWGKYITTLIIFKQIHSALHPEDGASFCGENFHQLHYLSACSMINQDDCVFLRRMLIFMRQELQ